MPPSRLRSWLPARWLPVAVASAAALVLVLSLTLPQTPKVPRVWDESALETWATPLAGLNERPTHMSAAEYYAIPEENLRTYPVYMPDAGTRRLLGDASPRGPAAAHRAGADRNRSRLDCRRQGRVLRLRRPADVRCEGHRDGARPAAMEAAGHGALARRHDQRSALGAHARRRGARLHELQRLPPAVSARQYAGAGASSFAIPNAFRNGLGGAIRAAERTLPGETPFSFSGSDRRRGVSSIRSSLGRTTRPASDCERSRKPNTTPGSPRAFAVAA